MVAPNGARKGKSDHPALPLTPAELAATARACAAAGATAIHLHVRDAAGRHSLDPGAYRAAIAAITAAADLRVQITTEAAGLFDVAAQIDCLAQGLAPEASVALREIERAPDRLAEAYRVAEAAGTEVQHILYAPEDLTRLLGHLKSGTIPAHFTSVLFVLGRYAAGQRSVPEDLDPFLAALGPGSLTWSVCAFGPREQDCLLHAIRRGGNVRIGFENNHLAPDGTLFTDNAAAVAALVAAAARAGFEPRGLS
ncbi:MAG TPA: 3-keto-5-aminohexanoate cleavage protein [Rhodobacteraceae bacterium]|nr:3-keto-5-aminohexanoate cleavage protein [Paracoccaceae bacterium]